MDPSPTLPPNDGPTPGADPGLPPPSGTVPAASPAPARPRRIGPVPLDRRTGAAAGVAALLLLAFLGFPQPLAAVLLVAVLGSWLLRLFTAPVLGRGCRRGGP